MKRNEMEKDQQHKWKRKILFDEGSEENTTVPLLPLLFLPFSPSLCISLFPPLSFILLIFYSILPFSSLLPSHTYTVTPINFSLPLIVCLSYHLHTVDPDENVATVTFKQEPLVPLSGQSLLWSASPESLANLVISGVGKSSMNSQGQGQGQGHSNGWGMTHSINGRAGDDRL